MSMKITTKATKIMAITFKNAHMGNKHRRQY